MSPLILTNIRKKYLVKLLYSVKKKVKPEASFYSNYRSSNCRKRFLRKFDGEWDYIWIIEVWTSVSLLYTYSTRRSTDIIRSGYNNTYKAAIPHCSPKNRKWFQLNHVFCLYFISCCLLPTNTTYNWMFKLIDLNNKAQFWLFKILSLSSIFDKVKSTKLWIRALVVKALSVRPKNPKFDSPP